MTEKFLSLSVMLNIGLIGLIGFWAYCKSDDWLREYKKTTKLHRDLIDRNSNLVDKIIDEREND